MTRPTRDEYFMAFAVLASERSACLRHKIGAVIIVDGQVVSTGYNGPPRGVSHCQHPSIPGTELEHGFDQVDECPTFYDACNCNICVRIELDIPSGTRIEDCRGLHAEQNAIVQAARHGISIKDSTMYCNFKPCITCMKMIINAGIKEVIYQQNYDDPYCELMAEAGGITLRKFDFDV